MGNREKFVIDFEGKVIEYQGRSYGVIRQFEYNGVDYLCCVEKVEKLAKINYMFLYREKDDVFAHVSDPNLEDALLIKFTGLASADIMKKRMENDNNV